MTGSRNRRWRRLEPDARREQILDCAMQLFRVRPYSAVSTTEIAQAAGVARGLLNHYFGTKRALYLAVVRRMVALRGIDAVEPIAGSRRTRIDAAVEWYLDRVAENRAAFLAVIGAASLGADPEIDSILSEADDRTARAALELIGISRDRQTAAERAVLRACAATANAAVRAWMQDGTLTREQARLLLTAMLRTLARDVLPHLEADR